MQALRPSSSAKGSGQKNGAPWRAASIAVDQATISVVAAWPMVPTAKSTAPRPVRSTSRLVWSVSA
ncbi:hypothetical protein C4K18_2321 [Pseudomonas chlororaphis subsp. aurantiaca]|nr:hypothetical protein C4K18_2321 [Pseudomonas chlororaphis subsp. aurantiaca]